MNVSRLGAGAAVIALLVAVWLPACTNGVEPCGAPGQPKTGACDVGPSCPSGTVEVLISDPPDMCPESNAPGGENYICCAPAVDAGQGGSPVDSGTGG